jgi:hypothetical protein
MKLKQFVEKLQHMLKNPNALVSVGSVIYVFTDDREFIMVSIDN